MKPKGNRERRQQPAGDNNTHVENKREKKVKLYSTDINLMGPKLAFHGPTHTQEHTLTGRQTDRCIENLWVFLTCTDEQRECYYKNVVMEDHLWLKKNAVTGYHAGRLRTEGVCLFMHTQSRT